MSDNPYQPPQTPPQPSSPEKARAVMALLALLSVPAAAIAGSATCNGLGYVEGPQDIVPLNIAVGWGATMAVVVGALCLERSKQPQASRPRVGPLVGWLLASQVLALPLGIGFGVLVILLMIRTAPELGFPNGWTWAIFLAMGFGTFLICALPAYGVWRWRERMAARKRS